MIEKIRIKLARQMFGLGQLAFLASSYLYQFPIRASEQFCDCGKCGYGCAWVEPYGWVPEAGCPVHDHED